MIAQTKILMGMPITVKIVDVQAAQKNLDQVFEYFRQVDEKFSTYKTDSEISKINRGEVDKKNYSSEVQLVLKLSEDTKNQTNGYFNIQTKNGIDPSGLVKGWAILNAAGLLKKMGFKNYCVEAGGDIQTIGKNENGEKWRVGIQNPFKKNEIVKVIQLSGEGMATSGSYERGQHIYNPHDLNLEISDIVSLTVIGPNIYEADRFATAAFAMDKEGINFIEGRQGLEGYIIDKNGIATMTSGFEKYTFPTKY